MSLLRYVSRRLLELIPVALGVTLVVFFLIHLVPGDPAVAMLGPGRATPQAVAELHREWGLDKRLPVQYGLFLGRLVRGNLGVSLFYDQPVGTLVLEQIPATLWLLGYTGVLAMLLAFPLATVAALREGRWQDHVIRAISLVGLGLPAFWVGIMLILIFGLHLRLFPVGGFGEGLVGHLRAMFLPALTMSLAILPYLLRSLRTAMLETLNSPFVVTARSKGISESRVFLHHVSRNAAIPAITVFGVNMGWLVGGTLIIENVFGIPGIGHLMVQATLDRDFPMVQGIALVFAFMVIMVNLATDISYSLLDPRVRFD
ncbi:MAG: ABC transporter permease [Actinomycetota bacterium]|nr:ABC transporter permease [Actinomycetota bacterium]